MTRDQEIILRKIQGMGQQMLDDPDYQDWADEENPIEVAADMLKSITNWIRFIDITDKPEPDIEE